MFKVKKVNNALTQIHFNGTNFINARLTQRVFCLTRGPTRSCRNGYAQLSNIADPFSDFFSLQKSGQTLFSFWELPVLPREREVLLSQRAHTPLSLSLSLSLSLVSLSLSLCICSV